MLYSKKSILTALVAVFTLASAAFAQVVPMEDPKSPAADTIKQAKALEEQRDYAGAEALFRKALELNPQSRDAQYGIAECYERRNEFDSAVAEYKKTLLLFPQDYESYLSIWQISLRRVRGNADAENLARQAVQKEFEELFAQAKSSAGETVLPEILYFTALSVYSEDCLNVKDKFNETAVEYVKNYYTSKSDIMNWACQTCFESILARRGKERLEPAKEYVQNFPPCSQRDVCFRIILSYLSGLGDPSTKNIPELKKYCELWTASEPDNVMAMAKSAWVYVEFDVDYDRALAWLNKALPILEEKEKQPKPVWYYEDLYRDQVRAYEVLQLTGYAYMKKGSLKDAEKYLLQSLSRNDFCETTNYYLGRCYELRGDMNRAFEYFGKSLICRGTINKAKDAFLRTGMQAAGCAEDADSLRNTLASWSGMVSFTDVTLQAGLVPPSNLYARTWASRIAWGDYNNDGFQDMLVNGCCLWKNNGGGTFSNVTDSVKISGGYAGGVWADFNNDGWLDFFSSGTPDALWRNNGDGTFANVTTEYGNLSDDFPSEGAGWGDYDRDGFVDLYVANYEKPGAELSNGTPDMLWHNVNGTFFKNASEEAKMAIPENMCGRGVSWADYNQDGLIDIMVSNYRLDPDFLWKNNGDGTFTNLARQTGVEGREEKGYFGHTIGSDWADYDNDGDWDLFEANLAHPRYIEFSNMSYLLENQGAPEYVFKEVRKESGIRYEETHSNPAFCDYDNDGWQDLYITSVYEKVPSFFYKSNGDKTFTDITWLAGVRVLNGWGCAWADYDNDGDMDLAVAGGNQMYLFRSECPAGRHWLELKLRGTHCNSAAIGAQVTVSADGKKYMRQVEGGSGTTNQDSLTIHFGLGDFSGNAGVEITWPCGARQEFSIETDGIIEVMEAKQ